MDFLSAIKANFLDYSLLKLSVRVHNGEEMEKKNVFISNVSSINCTVGSIANDLSTMNFRSNERLQFCLDYHDDSLRGSYGAGLVYNNVEIGYGSVVFDQRAIFEVQMGLFNNIDIRVFLNRFDHI